MKAAAHAIGGKLVGEGQPCLVVAHASINRCARAGSPSWLLDA